MIKSLPKLNIPWIASFASSTKLPTESETDAIILERTDQPREIIVSFPAPVLIVLWLAMPDKTKSSPDPEVIMFWCAPPNKILFPSPALISEFLALEIIISSPDPVSTNEL